MNNTDTTAEPTNNVESTHQPRNGLGSLPLRRPVHGRMLAGVAAGIADYFGVDATIVRIALVVATFFGGAGIAVYLAGWLLIPEEGTDQPLISDLFQSISTRSR
jgi:phage shock protein C